MCMIIGAIHNNKYKTPAFGSCVRNYNPQAIKDFQFFDKKTIQTLTNLFRNDLDWQRVTKYFAQNFKDKSKVNAYSLACSDGSEAYSYAISIMEFLPKELQSKFLPVFASDIDGEIIRAAKTNRINLFPIEFLTAEQQYGIDISKYFKEKNVSVMIEGDKTSESDMISSYKPIQILQDSIQFKQSDILTELKNIKDDGNSIIICRNVFPYLGEKYTDEVIKTAGKNLKDGSLFIIGDFDGTSDIETKLTQNGFYKPLIECSNVFKHGNGNIIHNRLYGGYLI